MNSENNPGNEDRDDPFPGLDGKAEELFGDWRIAVGFEREFPRLGPLMHPWPERNSLGQEQMTRDSMRFFLGKEQREVAREVYESLGSSRVVRTAPGHGATTLARWVHDQAAQEAISRRMIPVLVSLEQIIGTSYEQLADGEKRFLVEQHGGDALGRRCFDTDRNDEEEEAIDDLIEAADERAATHFSRITPTICAETIEAYIRFAVVRSLATRPWERVFTRAQCRNLIGTASGDPQAIEAQRLELADVFERAGDMSPPLKSSDDFWNGVASVSPSLAREDYHEILRDLNSWGRVRVSLMLDLSATPMGRQYLGREYGEHLTEPYMTVLKHVNKALKNIEQSAAGGPEPIMPSLLDTTFFLSRPAWSAFSAEFQAQEDQVIDFPAFRPVDLFAILANHYPPESQQHTGGRVEVLAAVLDSEFLELNEKTAISTEMVLLEQQLKHELSSRDGIAYHLRRSHPPGQAKGEGKDDAGS